MPTLFSARRASVSQADPLQHDSPTHTKRRSMDAGRPPVSGNKFKDFFKSSHHQMDDGQHDTGRRRSSVSQTTANEGTNSLRKRLSSASQIFSHKSPSSTEPHLSSTPSQSQSQSPNGIPAPNLFPENYALASTASPEGGGRRGSVNWQPSYPTVLPDDSYADLAPDGRPAIQGVELPASPTLPSENQHRRSLLEANGQMPTPSPDEQPNNLNPKNHFHANGQIPTPSPDEQPRPITPPPAPASPLTPPPSATTPNRTLEEPQSPKGRRPTLSLITDAPADGTLPSATPISTTESVPSPSRLNGKPRPDVPLRRTTLIQSPPMPQPIKNLPSMVGWPAFMKDGVPGTPAWNQSAGTSTPRTPGWSGGAVPKTPGWAHLTSPHGGRTPVTPGGSGFPFALPPTTVGQNKGKGKAQMSEEELRKARRAMVSRRE